MKQQKLISYLSRCSVVLDDGESTLKVFGEEIASKIVRTQNVDDTTMEDLFHNVEDIISNDTGYCIAHYNDFDIDDITKILDGNF